MFVPSWDIIWRSSILVHGILVEVAGVEVWLDGGKDGDLQGALTEAWRETMECENNNNNNNNATTNLPSWNHQTICVSECLECHLSDNPVSLRCYLWRRERKITKLILRIFCVLLKANQRFGEFCICWDFYLQSFLMSSLALAVMFLGKSMASMPFRMIL